MEWNFVYVLQTGTWLFGIYGYQFLGAFAKLRKVTNAFRPRGTTRLLRDGFRWNFIFELFRKSVLKIQVSLKSEKNDGYFI